MAAFLFSWWGYNIFLYLHLICNCTSLLGKDHYYSGGGEGWGWEIIFCKHFFNRYMSLQTFFSKVIFLQTYFSIFFSVLFIHAKYYHCLIKLLKNDVQGAEGTQHEKRQKPLSSFVKKDLIDEAQKSTNFLLHYWGRNSFSMWFWIS